MSSIVIKGNTSGQVEIAAPDVAGSTTLTLPTGTANLLTADGDGSQLTNLPQPASLSTASGSAPSYSARAWVNFNGTGTVAIRESGNVSSITDNGTGDYTVNFTTAMPDSNYSSNMSVNFSRTIGSSRLNASLRTRNTSNIRMQSIGDDGNSYDSEDVDISVFR
jgi:hypothetical protein